MFSDSINERVMKIKSSSEERSIFIQEYKPFIAAAVEKCTGRYVNYGTDDELSIGLLAFDEAIKSYDQSRGSFLSFAQGVIRRRLIDFYRKEKKHQAVVYIDDCCTDNSEKEDIYDYIITAGEVQNKYYEQEINEVRRQELAELKEELARWELSLKDIAKSSPKHAATKKSYLEIVRFILDNEELLKKTKTKMYLPIAEIEAGTKLPRKTIERARNYVIAALIIMSGDYYCIREFIDWGWAK